MSFELNELEHEKWCITTLITMKQYTLDGRILRGMKMGISGRAKKLLRRLLEQTTRKNIRLSLQVEKALSYRKSLKDNEKLIKKENRKKKGEIQR